MKKNYTSTILIFVFGLLFSLSSHAQLIAHSDSGTVTHSNNVQIAIQDVLANDTLNGIPVTLSQVTISQISSSTTISLQPNGSVVVNAGAYPGFAEITYQVCEIGGSGNCQWGYASVQILPQPPVPIVIGPDAVTISTGLPAPQIVLENILSNDTLGGIPITLSDVHIVSQVSSTTNFTLDMATGNVVQVGNPPAGNYTVGYTYCSVAQPNNCVSGAVAITVVSSLSTTINSTYQDLNGDGITNVGDVINYTYSISNIGSVPVSDISITSSDVNINGGPSIPLMNPGGNDNSTYTGIHVITQEDINNGHATVAIQTNGTRSGTAISISTTNVVNLNTSNGIRLNAFVDYNSNGTQDSGEPTVTYGSFQYEINNNGTVHNIASSTGDHYMYETNPANSYDLGYTLNTEYASQYSINPASYPNVTVPNGSGVVTYNFALKSLNPITNMSVYMYYMSPPRPGFTYQEYISYYNNGNQTIPSGTLIFTHGSNVSLVSTTPSSGVVTTANGFTFNFTNLLPGQHRQFYVTLQVPTIPTVNLGDWIINTVNITTPVTESETYNNTDSDSQIIVGSWDPNDKTESHGPQIQHSSFTANDYLTYTIRFENTGTAEAINIRVNDVLDSKLDETTVRTIASSHPYVLDRVGSNLNWRFNGVNLEPSIPNDPITGHGYVVFQVKPKAGYVIGDVIPNAASIYFDFNPAIVTDTWSTTFVPFLGVSHFAFDNFKYHPNPVRNSLTLSNDSTIDNVEIISVLGQRIKSIGVNSLQTEIDLSELNHGIYFVKVSSNGQEKTVKIIKE